jgi:branched-chain amino acid transport system ATP-binding protein
MSMPLLEVDQVSKRFGGLQAVDRVSFHVEPGEVVGLVGPNGAGKTTLFNLVSGFTRPDTGRVAFDGHDATRNQPFQSCRAGMGRTFQIVQPFTRLTVLENVMVGAFKNTPAVPEARQRALSVLDFVGLRELAERPANALTLLGRKRLEVARALATEPRLLLLDEIMAGLRPGELADAMAMIRRIVDSGIAVILIEHVMRAVMSLSGRVVVLHHGVKIAEGTPSEVTSDRAVIDAYLGEEVAGAGHP